MVKIVDIVDQYRDEEVQEKELLSSKKRISIPASLPPPQPHLLYSFTLLRMRS